MIDREQEVTNVIEYYIMEAIHDGMSYQASVIAYVKSRLRDECMAVPDAKIESIYTDIMDDWFQDVTCEN